MSGEGIVKPPWEEMKSEQNPASGDVESRTFLRPQTKLMGCIPTEVLVRSHENTGMKGETNLAPDGYWK